MNRENKEWIYNLEKDDLRFSSVSQLTSLIWLVTTADLICQCRDWSIVKENFTFKISKWKIICMSGGCFRHSGFVITDTNKSQVYK